MRKFFLAAVVFFFAFPAAPGRAGEVITFDLTRIHYKDDLRTVDYDFSGNDSMKHNDHSSSMTNIRIDSESVSTYVTYNDIQNQPYSEYGLGLEFQYRKEDIGDDTKIVWSPSDNKITYSFPVPSFEDFNGYYKTQGYPINLSSFSGNVGNLDLARNNWFYSMRVQNFTGFKENSLSEFEFFMLPPAPRDNGGGYTHEIRAVLPAFRLSAKYVKGLYRGKKIDGKFVLSAFAQRYGQYQGGNDPGAHGELIWKSGVNAANPAAEISLTKRPENTVLDLGVQVTEENGAKRSLVKLYYRLDSAAPSMEYDNSWTLFHTIPIPDVTDNDKTYKFPGMPVTLGGYAVRSEAIAFNTKREGWQNLTSSVVKAVDKTELVTFGISNPTPLSPQGEFTLDRINQGETVIFQQGLSKEGLLPEDNLTIKVRDVKQIKLLDRSGQKDHIFFKYKENGDLEDGEWRLHEASGTVLALDTVINKEESEEGGGQNSNYYVTLAIKDNGPFDCDDTLGAIEDPNILAIVTETPETPPSGGNEDIPASPAPPSGGNENVPATPAPNADLINDNASDFNDKNKDGGVTVEFAEVAFSDSAKVAAQLDGKTPRLVGNSDVSKITLAPMNGSAAEFSGEKAGLAAFGKGGGVKIDAVLAKAPEKGEILILPVKLTFSLSLADLTEANLTANQVTSDAAEFLKKSLFAKVPAEGATQGTLQDLTPLLNDIIAVKKDTDAKNQGGILVDLPFLLANAEGQPKKITDGTKKHLVVFDGANNNILRDPVWLFRAQVPLTDLTLAPSSLRLKKGESENVTASFIPENATDRNVTWTVAASSIASLAKTDSANVWTVQGLAVGTTSMTAVAGVDQNIEKTLTVTVLPENTELIKEVLVSPAPPYYTGSEIDIAASLFYPSLKVTAVVEGPDKTTDTLELKVEGTEARVNYVFPKPGNYTLKVTAALGDDTDEKTTRLTVADNAKKNDSGGGCNIGTGLLSGGASLLLVLSLCKIKVSRRTGSPIGR
jgi:hypothetical protein